MDLDILGITETKKKGKGMEEMDEGHILIYSGVNTEERAAEGVGCIINNRLGKNIKKWEFISSRILTIDIEIEPKIKTTVIVVYGPSEDERVNRKDQFWEALSDKIEEIQHRLIIVGDFNSRVGLKNNEAVDVIGEHGEDHLNDNGRRMLDFCIENNLLITNTFYRHKNIHKYTREVHSRRERSIIDYILINRQHRNELLDVRVYRGAEIYSDHYLLMGKMRINSTHREQKIHKRHQKSEPVIRAYRLQETSIANKYKEQTEMRFEEIKQELKNTGLEAIWKQFKDIVLTTAKQICGTLTVNNGKKQTHWWNDDIKKHIKTKKQLWRTYLGQKNEKTYLDYKKQRLKVKNLVMEAKRETWEEFGKKMEKDTKANQKLFYKILKNLRHGKQHEFRTIKTKDNRILTDEDDIMNRWKEYFTDLLNNNRQNEDLEIEMEEPVEKGGEEQIEIEEVIEAIKLIKKGKSAGHDKITPEMAKSLGKNGIEVLTTIYNKCWEEGKVPEDWKIGIILPIFKKGDSRDCKNYRGITLLSIISKIYEQILEKRLRKIIEGQLAEQQSGFRKGRSAQDHIFTIKQIIEKTKTKNCSTYVAFLDLEKAFDRVSQKRIWESLRQRGVKQELRKAIESLYDNNKCYVRKNNLQTEKFRIEEGLRQGGVMSPALFITVMDDVIKAITSRVKKVHIGYNKLKPIGISECAFADDVMICASKEEDLRESLIIWGDELKKRNLKMNISKTKVMVIGQNNRNLNIAVNNESIEQVDQYKYLGVTIERNGNMEQEINERISSASRLYFSLSSFMSNKAISTKTKMIVYKTVFRPILTYGSESWILTSRLHSKIQALDMKYLRRVKGISKRDRIRNDVVRQELGVESILEVVERNQLKWFGHVIRMRDERQVKNIWKAKAAKKKKRGRPTKTWNDQITAILKKREIQWNQAENLAKNKKEWAKFVYAATK